MNINKLSNLVSNQIKANQECIRKSRGSHYKALAIKAIDELHGSFQRVTIGKVARKAGISISTINAYEEIKSLFSDPFLLESEMSKKENKDSFEATSKE